MSLLTPALGCILALLPAALAAGATVAATPTDERPEMAFQEAWYLENGLRDLPAAIKAYEEIVQRFADRPELAAQAQLHIVDCYDRMGPNQTPQAMEALQKAYRLFPQQVKKYPARMGDLKAVLTKFDEALGPEPDLGDTGFVREIIGMLDVNAASKICDSYFQTALQERAEHPQEAILNLRKTVAIGAYLGLAGSASEAQTIIGDIYSEQGKYSLALSAYTKALDEFPKEARRLPWIQMRIAETYRLMGDRFEEAVAAYKAVGANYPEALPAQAWAFMWLGDLYRDRGKLDEARAVWQIVVDRFKDPETATPAAVAASLLDDKVPARVVDPKDTFANDVAYFNAVRFEMLDQPAEAQQDYRECMTLSVNKDWPWELARRVLVPAVDGKTTN